MLQHITTKEKTYPLNFGIRTLAIVADSLGMTMDKMVKEAITPDMSFGDLVKLVLAVTSVAMTEGARKSGEPHRYTEDNVADLIDEDGELLAQLIQMFRMSLSIGGAVFQTATVPGHANPARAVAAPKKGKK